MSANQLTEKQMLTPRPETLSIALREAAATLQAAAEYIDTQKTITPEIAYDALFRLATSGNTINLVSDELEAISGPVGGDLEEDLDETLEALFAG